MTWQSLRGCKSVVVSALGITQTLAWASTYYLTAVFADPVSADLHLSRTWFFGAVSAALLLSGLLGPIAGRMIDRHGGRDVLTATNLVFAAGLGLLSCASGPATLVMAWLVIGVGMGFGLYEAAFATAAGLYGREARNAITGITLFAGFASTVGWPASAGFIDAFGWRGACLAWAALHLVLGVPLNRLVVPKAPPPLPAIVPDQPPAAGVPWTMIVLATVFGATWFVATALAAHLPRLLEAMGATPSAAIAAAALVGPAQVVARVAEFGLLRHAAPIITARLAAGLHPVGALSMPVEFSPKVPVENSPLRFGSVASVSAWRLDVGEFGQVEVDDGLQGFGGGGLTQGVRQGVSPGGVAGLQGEEFGDGVTPALGLGPAVGRPAVADGGAALSGVSGAVAGLALGVAERVAAFALWAFWHAWPPLRNA